MGLKKLEYRDLIEQKQQRLVTTAAWTRLARKLLLRENKKQSLRVIGRWRILYVGLKTVDFQEHKDNKLRKMQINAKWRLFATKLLKREKKIFGREIMEVYATWNKFARLLLQRHYKLKSMGYTSKWQRFARMLLNRHGDKPSARVIKRWQVLLKGLARRPSNNLSL